MLTLRALNPQIDISLFREAYSWRSKKNKRAQPDQMPFEVFAAPDPYQVVMGLFNGNLQAVYLIQEYSPAKYEIHYTSQRTTPRESLIAAGAFIVQWLMDNGAQEAGVWLMPRNRAYVKLAQECGLEKTESRIFEIRGKPVELDHYAALASGQSAS